MATPPYTIATTSPADTDLMSIFPGQERPFRDTVWSWLNQIANATTGNINPAALPGFVNSWEIQSVNATTNAVLTFDNSSGVTRVVSQWDYANDKWSLITYATDGVTPKSQLDVIGGTGTANVNVALGTFTIGGIAPVMPSYIGALTGLTGVGALTAGSIGGSFGAINIGTNTLTAGASTLGAITSSGNLSVTGTGTFSSSISTTALTASTGNIQATAGNVIIGGNILATVSANTLSFRPNGAASSTGQMQLASNGNLTVAGDVTANSDRRLKTSISPINKQWAEDMVREVEPMTFIWKRKGHERGIGFIAQDVAGYAPELVHSDEHGILSLAYPNMVAILWGAVQRLQKKVAELEARPHGAF